MAIREGYATVTEAARMLGVVRNTIRSWGADGKIPEYRHPVNNYRLYKRTDLERLVRKLEQSVGARAAKLGRKKPR
ncbi:MAG: helix-turn-helix domain-containing protein [Pirellulaceae bacterium]